MTTLTAISSLDPAAPADPPLPGRRDIGATIVASLRAATPALLLYIAVRAVGLTALAVWAHTRGASMWDRLFQWDAIQFGALAAHGYDGGIPLLSGASGAHSNLAFFPVYPNAIRVVHAIAPIDIQTAAIAIAWTASVAAAWGIFATASHRYGRRAGILAAALWGAQPIAIIQNMAYSESLFTAFAAWSLYAAVRRQWLWAGALGAIAGLTRANGIAVAAGVGLAAAVELLRLYRAHRRGDSAGDGWRRPLLGAAVAPLGWFGYIGWVGHEIGRWDGYFTVQASWGPRYDFGAHTATTLKTLLISPHPFYLYLVAGVLLCSVVLFAVGVSQRQAPALLAYTFVLILIAVGDDKHFWCQARFLLPAFPLVFPVAAALARARTGATTAVLLTSATLVSAVCGGHLLLTWALWP